MRYMAVLVLRVCCWQFGSGVDAIGEDGADVSVGVVVERI